MDKQLLTFFVFFVIGAALAVTPLFISWFIWLPRRNTHPTKELLRPAVPDEIPWLTPKEYKERQHAPYESGMPSFGSRRIIGYEYLIYVILFLIFDIIFVSILFGLGAWLRAPQPVSFVIGGVGAVGCIMIFYGLKPRKYLRL